MVALSWETWKSAWRVGEVRAQWSTTEVAKLKEVGGRWGGESKWVMVVDL